MQLYFRCYSKLSSCDLIQHLQKLYNVTSNFISPIQNLLSKKWLNIIPKVTEVKVIDLEFSIKYIILECHDHCISFGFGDIQYYCPLSSSVFGAKMNKIWLVSLAKLGHGTENTSVSP